MAGHFCCGFECGVLGAGGLHWQSTSGTPTIDTGTVRSGDRSLRCNPSATTEYVTLGTTITAGNRQVGRFYVNFASLPSANTALCAVNNTLAPFVFFQQSDSTIRAAIGWTTSTPDVVGSSGVTVTTGQWYRIDFDFNCQSAGNDTCDVRVNGTACGQAVGTGVGTAVSGMILGVRHTCTADVFFDDIVLSATAADYPIGAGYVHHFVPTSDGSHNVAGANDFERTTTGVDITNATTDAYQLIDDVPLESGAGTDWINMIAPPNASDYVQCVFGPAPGIPSATFAARVVEFIIAYRQAGTGTGNMLVQWITPNFSPSGTSNDIYRAESVAGVTTIAYARKGDTNAASDGAPGNTTQIRFTSPLVLDVNPDQYLVSAMIEAEFAEQPASMPISMRNRNHMFVPRRRSL